MRDSSSWRKDLLAELRQASFPESVMSAEAFCAVELGLYLLARHFPGEPVGVLQPLLSGYVAEQRLDAEMRRVRHRMGDVARRGYWRRLLNHYMRVPPEWRCFERTDDPRRRVSDQTVFVPADSSYCPERTEAYAAAVSEPMQYAQATRYPPAKAGKRYCFDLPGGRVEQVQLPEVLPPAPPVEPLPVVTDRTRQPWTISFRKDLEPTAKWIDEQLANRPDITSRNWEKRLKQDMRFSAVDPASPTLIDQPEEFDVDGIAHIVGLMNSGKTTLADLITVNRVKIHGNRVCLVLSSVGDVLNKVTFLRTLGIEAVPLIGRSSRSEHSARYWRTMVEETATLFPDDDVPPDPAAGYANASCLLEPFRRSSRPGWAPLTPDEFPCRGRLREADANTPRPRHCDCPLLSICPAQKAYREIAAAEVWVTTPQCLVASRAEPHRASVRWFEAAQGHIDLMIIDEADAVQQVLDGQFVQTEGLVSKDKGWTYRMVGYTNESMADQDLAPTADPEAWRWYEQLQMHQQAVFTLNRLALSPEGEALKELLGDKPFTAHSLFRQVARALFGLSGDEEEDDKTAEDLAEDFYRQHLQDFAESPHEVPGHGLNLVVAELTRPIRNDDAVTKALDAWIDKNVSTRHVTPDWMERKRALLRLVIEAAIWAGRISTSFFEMATMYPSVRERLRLPDEETFWADQPPRDYRALVPEAPMGNILALRWTASRNGGASLQLLWVHGVGRWLLHHAHDLLACEGVQGPHVILTSATSWAPGSSFYHVPITPTAVLRQREADRAALETSTMTVRPMKAGPDAIFVSGRYGKQRDDSLRQMVTALCLPGDGRHRSLVDELRAKLPPDRRQILFVVLSGREARIVGDHINNRVPHLRARVVVPDAADPGRDGILRRLVGSFGKGSDDILVAAELSIQRGYNILNSNDTAALGAVVYLTRSHPPPFDLAFPLSLVSQLAIRHLENAPKGLPGQVAELVQQLRAEARKMWFGVIGRPVQFRGIASAYRPAFVANNMVPMSQTIGRTIRGNQPTIVLLCDAAFAPRLATGDSARDTQRTSIVVATDALLTTLLAPPREPPDAEQLRLHEINQAVWGLMGHLVSTNEPLGSQGERRR